MDSGANDQAAAARDGTPSVDPQPKGSGKKGKKPKNKPEQPPQQDGASCLERASPAQSPRSKPQGDNPASAKKQKANKKVEGQGQEQGQNQGSSLAQAQGDATQPPQKTKAELKAERRAVQEAQRAAKAGKKADDASQKTGQQKDLRVPSKVLRDDPGMQKKEEKKLAKQNVPQRSSVKKKVALFNHLKQYDRDPKHLTELPVWHVTECGEVQGIHPAVSTLGLKYVDFKYVGSNSRAVALLAAFQEVIDDYVTPKDKDLCRDLDAQISRLITFLDQCRPLSVSMGNAIKFLKWKINQIPSTMPEVEAKKQLNADIEKFIKEKVMKAREAISLYAEDIIKDGEFIIVYGHSSTVYKVLKKAKKRDLTVLVVDNRPRHEGKDMLAKLTRLGIKCIFVTLNVAHLYIRNLSQPKAFRRRKSKLLLGAHGVLDNAYVMSRIGTAVLASIAKAHNVPVFVCFETYKISDRSQTDSFVFNELGDAHELETVPFQEPILTDWQDNNKLGLLNLMYDVTPNSLISMFITEIGLIPDASIPRVLSTKAALYEK